MIVSGANCRITSTGNDCTSPAMAVAFLGRGSMRQQLLPGRIRRAICTAARGRRRTGCAPSNPVAPVVGNFARVIWGEGARFVDEIAAGWRAEFRDFLTGVGLTLSTSPATTTAKVILNRRIVF